MDIPFCLYCGRNILPEDEKFNSDGENITDDIDEDTDTPPKVDKIAFHKMHNAIPNDTKLKLSTGKIVENVLFEFAKDMDYE